MSVEDWPELAPPEPPDIPVPSPELEALGEVSLPELTTFSTDVVVAVASAEAVLVCDAGCVSGVAVAPTVDPEWVPLPDARLVSGMAAAVVAGVLAPSEVW